jgi:hypothetical protein
MNILKGAQVTLAMLLLATPFHVTAAEHSLTDDDWASVSAASIPFHYGGHDWFPVYLIPDNQGYFYVIGGGFYALGEVPGSAVHWDGRQWLPATVSGIPDDPRITPYPWRYAMVGGEFYMADENYEGGPRYTVIKLDGRGTQLGGDFDTPVVALASFGNELYACGGFTSVGDVAVNYIARWDGTSWVPVGGGMDRNVVKLMATSDVLYGTGNFTTAGGVPANHIAKWDGSAWSALGSGAEGNVEALAVSGSNLYVAGSLTSAGGTAVNRIARWDGTSWSALGAGVDAIVHALAVSGSDLYVGGEFEMAGGTQAIRIAKWDGESWSPLGAGIDIRLGDSGFGPTEVVFSMLAAPNGDIYISGNFQTVNGVVANSLTRWDGASWSRVGSNGEGIDGPVTVLAAAGRELYAAGQFIGAGGQQVNHVAKWDGTAWSPLFDSSFGSLVLSAIAPSGSNVYVGGRFTMVSGVEAHSIAKWDGVSWSALGSGTDGNVNAIVPAGANVFISGSFTEAGGIAMTNLAKWDGTRWSPVGSDFEVGGGSPLAVSDTKLYAVGRFPPAGGTGGVGIAQWDGLFWSAIAAGLGGLAPSVYDLHVIGTDLFVAGQFTSVGGVAANNIAQWDGTEWMPLGPGLGDPGSDHYVSALASFGMDLYAAVVLGRISYVPGGLIQYPLPPSRIYKWNGTDWTPLGSGTDGPVDTIAIVGDELFAGGRFARAGGKVSANLARFFLEGVPPLEVNGQRATAFFRGMPAGVYEVDRTTDFVTWENLATRDAGETGGIDFIDKTAPEARAFYRAIPVEP